MQRALPTQANDVDAMDVAKALLRVVMGVVFMAHGFQKLTDINAIEETFASLRIPMPGVSAWLAALAEFLGGVGLFLGCFTRIAGVATSIVMITAIAMVHGKHGLMAQNNGFEYPLVMLAVSAFFVLTGAGRYSLDHAFGGLYEKHADDGPRHTTSRGQPPSEA